jgi:hypothetical protein
VNPKNKRLTMTYLPKDQESGFTPDADSEETNDVEVSSAGDVVIGVPVAELIVEPTQD